MGTLFSGKTRMEILGKGPSEGNVNILDDLWCISLQDMGQDDNCLRSMEDVSLQLEKVFSCGLSWVIQDRPHT